MFYFYLFIYSFFPFTKQHKGFSFFVALDICCSTIRYEIARDSERRTEDMIKTKNQFFQAELKHIFCPERWYRLAQTEILNNMEQGSLLYRSTHPNEKFWSFQLDWNEIQNIDEKCFLFFLLLFHYSFLFLSLSSSPTKQRVRVKGWNYVSLCAIRIDF